MLILKRSLVFFVIFFSTNFLQAQDGQEILKKMDQVIFAPKDKQGNIKIEVINDSKDDKLREAVLLQKGADKKIYRYTKPEKQKGIATLSLPGDVMWMYMPAFDKPKKISLLAKSQAFTGTDFSIEDIPTSPYAERYNAKLTSTESDRFILELTPKSDKSNYSKLVISIDKSDFFPIAIDYYDKSGSKSKEARYRYSKIGKYWNADEVTMTTLKKKSSTRITTSDVKFDVGLADDLFTVEKFYK